MNLEDLMMYQTDLLIVDAGKTLFKAGDSGDSMYVLMSGTAAVLPHERHRRCESALPGPVAADSAPYSRLPTLRSRAAMPRMT